MYTFSRIGVEGPHVYAILECLMGQYVVQLVHEFKRITIIGRWSK